MRAIGNDWISYYLQYVEDKAPEYPRIWARWAAITAIAATLKRHVFAVMPNGGWKLYPTIYTILVGRPGLGKGLAMNDVMPIVREAKTTNIISGKLTMPYVLDQMSRGFPLPASQGQVGIDHSAFMWSSELSVFMNAYKDTVEVLTDLWDTLDAPFTYGTMSHSKKAIPSPTLTLLAGSAPEWLAKAIPPDAVGGGFTRRVNFVYADRKEPSASRNGSNLIGMYNNLVSDLREISKLRGHVQFNRGVLPLLEIYTKQSEPDEFDDAATAGYITTKPAHVIKLCMCLAAARDDKLIITENDFRTSVALVESTAAGMKKVFRSIGTGDYVVACDKVLRYLEMKMHQSQTNPNVVGRATRKELLTILWKDLSNPAELDLIIELLKGSGLITERQAGQNVYYEVIPIKAKGVTP